MWASTVGLHGRAGGGKQMQVKQKFLQRAISAFANRPSMGRRGNAMMVLTVILGGLASIMIGAFLVMITFFAGSTLNASLTDPNAWIFWGRTVAFGTNFAAQLPTLGTLLGVMLFLVVLGGGGLIGYGMYQKYKGGGGSGY